MKKIISIIIGSMLLLSLTACGTNKIEELPKTETKTESEASKYEELPNYSGEPYVVLNGNEPSFLESDLITTSYETYSELDADGKCGVAIACIGKDLMPTEERQSIGQVKPSGWKTIKYDIVEGKYLYNRCHLIGFQLTGENANERNLITGTRYMNTEGMLPFENMVADYIKETGNHVLYRVTPIFEGNNLVASGVQMEAKSVEDAGEGICFNVYVFNIQPGIEIDYATGDSKLATDSSNKKEETTEKVTYILNKNNKKFHKPTCSSVKDMKEENKQEYSGARNVLIEQNYEPCGRCNP